MKAIVLSCDKYHPITDHMIATYDEVWPGHPFRFRVPYQDDARLLSDRYGNRIDLIRTGRPYKQTLLGLLDGVPDDEWVYWCIDDKYPIEVRVPEVNGILAFVRDFSDASVAGVMFCRPLNLHTSEHVTALNGLVDPGGRHYVRRTTYAAIWVHQFLRATVLRKFFARMPDSNFSAKDMNRFQWDCPLPEGNLYVLDRSAAYFGESTTRGALTKNCARSLATHGMSIPDGFKLSEREMLIGHESFASNGLRLRWQVAKRTGRRRLAKLGLGKLARRVGIRG